MNDYPPLDYNRKPLFSGYFPGCDCSNCEAVRRDIKTLIKQALTELIADGTLSAPPE